MTQDNTKKLIDEIPAEERAKPPKEIGRVSVEDPEEKYGEPVLFRLGGEHREPDEGQEPPQTAEDEALRESLYAETWGELRENIDVSTFEKVSPILDFIREATGKALIDPKTGREMEAVLTTAFQIGKIMTDKHAEQKAYSRERQGDVEQILKDAQRTLESVTKEDFQNWIGNAWNDGNSPYNPDRLAKKEGKTTAEFLRESAYGWLGAKCKIYEFALKEWGKDTQPLKDLILKRAKEIAKRRYRKASDATGYIEKTDGRTPLITHPDYSGAFNLNERGSAYLQEYDPSLLPEKDLDRFNIDSLDRVSFDFEDGKLYLAIDGRRIPLMPTELKNYQTGKNVQKIDTALLKVVFGFFIQAKKEDPDTDTIWIRIPDLFYALSGSKNVPATSYAHDENGNVIYDEDGNKVVSVRGFKDRIIAWIEEEYQNLGGNIYEGGREPSICVPLAFLEYNEPENKIKLSSPYMNRLYEQIQRNKLTYKSTNDSGRTTELDKPAISFMLDDPFYMEKNRPAVRNVEIILDTIERTGVGNHDPHIAVRTIIERNELLRDKLKDDKHKTQTLQRAFKKTYELLRTHTHLQDKYKDIELPEHPQDTPTAKNYKTMVLHFRHKGLNKKTPANSE